MWCGGLKGSNIHDFVQEKVLLKLAGFSDEVTALSEGGRVLKGNRAGWAVGRIAAQFYDVGSKKVLKDLGNPNGYSYPMRATSPAQAINSCN